MNISSTGSHIGVPTEAALPISVSPAQRTLIQAVKAVNPTELFGEDHAFNFVVDPKSKSIVVRIVDRKTGKVVNQIPAEDLLRLAEENNGG